MRSHAATLGDEPTRLFTLRMHRGAKERGAGLSVTRPGGLTVAFLGSPGLKAGLGGAMPRWAS